MSFPRIIMAGICLLFLSSNIYGDVSVRLKGGWSIPGGEFSSKKSVYRFEGQLHDLEYSTTGLHSFNAEVTFRFWKTPIPLVLSCGLVQFDDDNWEIQETTYEYPLGTGRATDYRHEIIPITLSIELPIWHSNYTLGAFGIGGGIYRHKFLDYNNIESIMCYERSNSYWGSKIYYYQSFLLSKRIGIILGVDYNTLFLGGNDQINFAPKGFYKRVTFYRIEAGLLFNVVE